MRPLLQPVDIKICECNGQCNARRARRGRTSLRARWEQAAGFGGMRCADDVLTEGRELLALPAVPTFVAPSFHAHGVNDFLDSVVFLPLVCPLLIS